MEYNGKPFFQTIILNEKSECRELYELWKRTENIELFLILYTKVWMFLENVYMENVEQFYHDSFFEKDLFFDLIQYGETNLDKNTKYKLLTGYFYSATGHFFLMNKAYEKYAYSDIESMGKEIIQKLYNEFPEDFIICYFYGLSVDRKIYKIVKKDRDFKEHILNLFPTNTEVDWYFREIFM